MVLQSHSIRVNALICIPGAYEEMHANIYTCEFSWVYSILKRTDLTTRWKICKTMARFGVREITSESAPKSNNYLPNCAYILGSNKSWIISCLVLIGHWLFVQCIYLSCLYRILGHDFYFLCESSDSSQITFWYKIQIWHLWFAKLCIRFGKVHDAVMT